MSNARNLANIISGGFTADDIPSLDTAKVTTGTFDDARISATSVNQHVDLTNLNADNLTSGTVSIDRIGSSGTKDATTFLRGDNTFATVSSDYVKLSTSTISADTASVSFDGHFTSDYDTYIVYGNVQLDANAKIRARVRKSNSDVTSGNYVFSSYGIASNGSSGSEHGSGATVFTLNRDATIGNYRFAFETVIYNPLATYNHMIKNTASFYGSDGNAWWFLMSGFCDNNTNALSGISYYPSAGNFDAGTIVLYGVKK